MKGAGCDCLGLLRGVWRELRGEEPEDTPPYSPDWAESTGRETLYTALRRHLTEIDRARIAPGDIALFRMTPRGPAKHCGIVGERDGTLTLIHARQNKRVSEEVVLAVVAAQTGLRRFDSGRLRSTNAKCYSGEGNICSGNRIYVHEHRLASAGLATRSPEYLHSGVVGRPTPGSRAYHVSPAGDAKVKELAYECLSDRVQRACG